MGRDRYRFCRTNAPHFMTCTVLHWIPVFTRPETVNISLDSFNYLIKNGLEIYAYVILENHLHLIAQSERMDRDIARFKSCTSKKGSVSMHSHAGACRSVGTRNNAQHAARKEEVI